MEFCTVTLKQLDDNTAEIRTVVNTDVLLTLMRKKKPLEQFYTNLGEEIYRQLNAEFGNCEPELFTESLGDEQHRTHRGVTPHGNRFVSVLSVVKVNPQGWGLTNDLTDSIIQMIQGAMSEDIPVFPHTATTLCAEGVLFNVVLTDEKRMENLSLDEIVQIATKALEKEIRKEAWKARV